MCHIRYAVDVCQIEKPDGHALINEYERALTQLSFLIRSIERKIEERGKSKTPVQLKELPAEYLPFTKPAIDHEP